MSGYATYNFRTQEYEYDVDFRELSQDHLKDYMVQEPALHGLFDVFVAQGMTPVDAYEKTLREYIDINKKKLESS